MLEPLTEQDELLLIRSAARVVADDLAWLGGYRGAAIQHDIENSQKYLTDLRNRWPETWHLYHMTEGAWRP